MITIKQIESPVVVTDNGVDINLYAGETYTCEVPTTNEWFEIEIDTTIPGTTALNQYKLPFESGNFIVNYGDGNEETLNFTSNADPSLIHTYSVGGIYRVKFKGLGWLKRFVSDDEFKFTKIINWGRFSFDAIEMASISPSSLQITANDSPSLNKNSLIYQAFYRNINVVKSPLSNSLGNNKMDAAFFESGFDDNVGGWMVNRIVDFSSCFKGTSMSTANCDALLIGWLRWSGGQPNTTLSSNVSLHLGTTSYTLGGDAEDAFNYYVNVLNWAITIL